MLHEYSTEIIWTGNLGMGTKSYQAYARDFEVIVEGKPRIAGSADPVFRGDKTKYNPEELLIISISSCHMLWYLHLCADAGIEVQEYKDLPLGNMQETANGGGYFKEVLLRPHVKIRQIHLLSQAIDLHKIAHSKCFIANSCNFPILCKPHLFT